MSPTTITTVCRNAVIGATMALVAQGCAAGDSSDVEVRDNVEVLDQAMMAGTEVLDDALVVPNSQGWLAGIAPGHVLVSDVNNGYIRRVIGVERNGDHTVVSTEAGAITDALATAQFQHTYQDGVAFDPDRAEMVDFGINIDISNRVLFEREGLKVVLDEGVINFNPTVDFNLDIGFFTVKDFRLVATGELDADLLVTATAEAGFSAGGLDFTTELYRSEPKTIVHHIGPIPFVEVVEAAVSARFVVHAEGTAHAEVGGRADGVVTAGLVMADGRISPVSNVEFGVEAIGPALNAAAQVTARVELKPSIEVRFFSLADVNINVDAYGNFAGRGTFDASTGGFEGDIDCNLDFGLSADIDAHLNLFGLGNHTPQLFDINKPIACPF